MAIAFEQLFFLPEYQIFDSKKYLLNYSSAVFSNIIVLISNIVSWTGLINTDLVGFQPVPIGSCDDDDMFVVCVAPLLHTEETSGWWWSFFGFKMHLYENELFFSQLTTDKTGKLWTSSLIYDNEFGQVKN